MKEGMSDLKIPAAKVKMGDDFVRTKPYWYVKLNDQSREGKIRTYYLLTCYNYVNQIPISNAVFRERLGVEKKNKAIMSRIIRETLESGLSKLVDKMQHKILDYVFRIDAILVDNQIVVEWKSLAEVIDFV